MEKYQARKNDDNKDKAPKSKKQEREESSAKIAKTVAKNFASSYVPGIGGDLVDMAAKTKIGQDVFNRVGKMFAVSPVGRVAKPLDKSGAIDIADQAISLMDNPSKSSIENVASSKNSTNMNSLLNKGSDLVNNSNLENVDSNKLESSRFSSLFGNSGSFNIIDIIGKKYIIMGCAIFFIFIILITTIVSAKDYANLDLTNKSEAMGSYLPESINTFSAESISNIGEDLLNGGDAVILSNGDTLTSLLGVEGVNALSQSIQSSASLAGYGTGAAPAAAAQALITNLLNNNIIIPYFWGGGHGVISTAANGSWGEYEYVSAPGHFTSFSNQPLGMDCSGFVSWALYNGGCKNFSPINSSNFKELGPSITISQAKTGDIAASDGHVMLILQNNNDTVLFAEAKDSSTGVVFTTRSSNSLSKYTIVDMSSYYQQNCS